MNTVPGLTVSHLAEEYVGFVRDHHEGAKAHSDIIGEALDPLNAFDIRDEIGELLTDLGWSDNPDGNGDADPAREQFITDAYSCVIAILSDTYSVTVQRSQLYPSVARPGFAWKWTYETKGPDGTKFTNDSIVELRKVLKRRYGKTLAIVEPWKAKVSA